MIDGMNTKIIILLKKWEMDNNIIVEQIYKDGWLKKYIYSLSTDKQLMKDLYQEINIILLMYKNETLSNAYQKNEYKGLIKKIVTNQYYSTTSMFFNKYRKNPTLQLIDEIYGI